jgi:hypothetical protein
MPSRFPRISISRRFLRITGAVAAFILLLLALAAWQVPEFTRRALTRDVAGMLGRDVQVGKITFNPFTLTLRAHDLAIAQPGGAQPLFALSEADVSASWKSLFWFAPVVDRLVLRQPRVALVRDGQAHFNFSDVQRKLAEMGAEKPQPPEEKEKGLPRFSLNNMRLENGSITLDDQVTGRKQVIDQIDLGVPFVSNFGYATDIDVVPKFHARINGSPFDLNGKARPFDVVPTSTLDVVFSDLDLEKWADAWGVPLPVKLKQGLLDSDLHIAFEQPRDAAPKLRITGGLSLRELDLREASDENLLAWKALNVRGVDALPLERRLQIGEVELVDPRIQTRRYADQRVNWLDVIDKLQRLGAGARTAGPSTVSTVKTAALNEKAGPVSAAGREKPAAGEPAAGAAKSAGAPGGGQPAVPGDKAAAGDQAAASGGKTPTASADKAAAPMPASSGPAEKATASTPGDKAAASAPAAPEPADKAAASAPSEKTAASTPSDQAAASAPAASAPAASAPAASAPADAEPNPWHVNVDKISIANGRVRVRDAATRVDYTLDKLAVSVEHVRLPQPKDEPIDIRLNAENPDGATLQASGGLILQPLAVNLDARAAHLPLAPFASAVRSVAPVVLLGGNVGVAAKVDVKDRNGTYVVQASDVKLDLADVSARDESLNPPVAVAVKTLNVGVDKLALGPGASRFDLRGTGILGEGQLSSQGTFTLQPLGVKARVDLSNLNVAQLAPYAASSLNATVRSIRLGAKGDVDFAAAQGSAPMKVLWKGGVDVSDLNLQDRVNRADFLAWKLLSLKNMDVSMGSGKPSIDLGDVTLDNFYGNVLLNSQGRLNVLDLVAEPGKAGGSITEGAVGEGTKGRDRAGTPPPESRRAAGNGGKDGQARRGEAAADAGMPDISLRSVTLKNGRATFNDRFVRPNYRAELSAIQGSVSAVSSTNPKPAKVSVKGRVYGTAPLTISGIVQPFAKYLALDIKASARGVDLPRFTTYSSKYVGYPIERGKLSLDVEYVIKNRHLQARNRVQLDQLTFGAKTDSPQATTLPVMLAVALLKDRNGNIDINLPISGSLDDPEFSVGGIILRVIGNLIVKAVTSPFSLIASAFGGGDELSYITFEPGSSQLGDDAKEKLKKLAAALGDRPSLKMDIAGRADPAVDEAGLRQAWVDRRIRAARASATGKSARLDGDEPLSAAERAKYLEDAYDDTKIANKPRNFIGIAKSLPPEQMEQLMRQAAPAGPEQLRRLADARAQAAYEQLQQDGAPMDRIFMVAPKLTPEGIKDKDATTRVEFSLKR